MVTVYVAMIFTSKLLIKIPNFTCNRINHYKTIDHILTSLLSLKYISAKLISNHFSFV